jgi:hypothetical protein
VRGRWRHIGLGVVICACLAVAPTDSMAAVLTLPASETAVLQNPADLTEQRLLIRFDVPAYLSEGTVEIALLELRTTVISADSPGGVTLNCFPVTTDWVPEAVDWSEGWTSAGGDHDETSHAMCAAAVSDSSLLRFDVTGIVESWTATDMGNYGVVVTAAPSEAGALEDASVEAVAHEHWPKLTIWFAPRKD